MSSGGKPSIYLRIRAFVDREQATRARPATPFLGAIPIATMGLAQQYLDGNADIVGWSMAVATALAWTVFAWWRGYRLLRAAAIKGDRSFDQRGKFLLSPEYWATRSVLKARRRK